MPPVRPSALRTFRLQSILDIQQASLENHPIGEFLLIEVWAFLAEVVPRTYFFEEIEDLFVFINYSNFFWVHVFHLD
jgi:hypothetical protein